MGVIWNVLQHVKHCDSVIGFFLDLWRKLIDRRVEHWHWTLRRCKTSQCGIGFNAFKARVRGIYFQEIMARPNANLQNLRLWRPFKPRNKIPQYKPPAP